MSEKEDRPLHCMTTGCICCYEAFDFQDFICCANGACDCLCIRHAFCLQIGAPNRGCGMVTDVEKDEMCKIALYCCDCGIIHHPKIVCASVSHCLCVQNVASYPFQDDYVPECVCAYLFFQFLPHIGCCVAPPLCKALSQTKQIQPLKAPKTEDMTDRV